MSESLRLPDGSLLPLGDFGAWTLVRFEACQGILLELTRRSSRHRGDVDMRLRLEMPDLVLYRFPFPDEDGAGLEELRQRQPRRPPHPVFVPWQFAATLKHDKVPVRVTRACGGYGVDQETTCPNTAWANPEFDQRGILLDILGERVTEHTQAMTVLACIYCQARFRFSTSEIEVIRDLNLSHHSRNATAIINRLKGYESDENGA